jgi:hypothetical protein
MKVIPEGKHITYQTRYVKCSSQGCKCHAPGNKGHGPYRYGYATINKKLKSFYLGKVQA